MKYLFAILLALALTSCAHFDSAPSKDYKGNLSEVSRAFEGIEDDAQGVQKETPEESKAHQLGKSIEDRARTGKQASKGLGELNADYLKLQKSNAQLRKDLDVEMSKGKRLIDIVIACAFAVGLAGIAASFFLKSKSLAGAGIATVIAASVSYWLFQWAWAISLAFIGIVVVLALFLLWRNRKALLEKSGQLVEVSTQLEQTSGKLAAVTTDNTHLSNAVGQVVLTAEMLKTLGERIPGANALIQGFFKSDNPIASGFQSPETQAIVSGVRSSDGFQARMAAETKELDDAELKEVLKQEKEQAVAPVKAAPVSTFPNSGTVFFESDGNASLYSNDGN